MRGESSRAEARAVVRHLLTGCPSCRRITGRLWRLGEQPLPREGGTPFMTRIETAKAQIEESARDLKAVKFRLLGVRASLRPQEAEPADPETELRTVIECVLHDSLEPAIESLEEAVERRLGQEVDVT